MPVRAFGGSAAHAPAAAATSDHPAMLHPPKVLPDGVVVPQLVDTLEWLLDSPPNIHQFEEPPVIDLIIAI